MPDADTVRVLVVEDSSVLCRIAELKLRKLGLLVDVVRNGRDAVTAVQEYKYDLILMDVHMPQMCGLDATREIRKAEAATGRHIPIVAVTASDSWENCMAAGMDDYVQKPADYETIIKKWLPEFEPRKTG
jgi:two-component system, sensor histidine kinase and response regulator